MSERDRDRSIDALLRRTAGPDATPPSGDCLAPDTIAAWLDGGLTREERASAEAHAAGCPGCQAILAMTARTTPVFVARPWWHDRIRWLIPIAATAVALTIWTSLGTQPRSRPLETATLADKSTTAAPAAAPSIGPSPSLDRMSPAPELRKSKPGAPPAAAPQARIAREADERARPRNEAGATAQDPLRAVAPPVVPGAPPAAASVQSRAAAPTAFGRPLEIPSPDRAVRWRVGAGGTIQRSIDGGGTWQEQPSPVTTELTAGSSASPLLCWIVGRAGTVLLSVDGHTWRRLPFPESADLTAVTASDASTATVTTADGRRFSTTDGGQTWRPQQ